MWTASHFHYEAEADQYQCPQGPILKRVGDGPYGRRLYRAPARVCTACPVKAHCTTSSKGRLVTRSIGEQYIERVRAYHQTAAYQRAYRQRQVWVEPLFAEAKDWHGMRRFRLRRLWRVNGEALLIASGQNLKRSLAQARLGTAPTAQRGSHPSRFLCWMLGTWSVQIPLATRQGYPLPAAGRRLASYR